MGDFPVVVFLAMTILACWPGNQKVGRSSKLRIIPMDGATFRHWRADFPGGTFAKAGCNDVIQSVCNEEGQAIQQWVNTSPAGIENGNGGITPALTHL
jgi:hypothetical protein